MTCAQPRITPMTTVPADDNARLVLQTFFDEDYGLAHARKRLHACLRSAFAHQSRLNKMEMLNMLYFIELFGKLIAAAEQLTTEPGNREKGSVINCLNEHDLLNPALYCNNMPGPPGSRQGLGNAWQCFPRHLSRAEYLDPYWALEKCFQRKNSGEWKELLMGLFYAAAKDENTIAEDCHDADIYRSCKGLFKLLEACHLIKVRESGS